MHFNIHFLLLLLFSFVTLPPNLRFIEKENECDRHSLQVSLMTNQTDKGGNTVNVFVMIDCCVAGWSEQQRVRHCGVVCFFLLLDQNDVQENVLDAKHCL